MGVAGDHPGTVVGAMADPSEPDAGADAPAAEPAETASDRPSPGRRRTLDRRTVAICAVLGVIAAIATVLVASAFSSSSDGSDDAMVLKDTDVLLTQPLETVDGEETDLTAFHEDGTPMLVNLWQSTCEPCVREMPLLDAAQADNPDVTFVGVATQETHLDAAEKLAEQTKITYPWVLDPDGEFFYEAGGQGMPTTLLLDGTGAIVSSHTGEFSNASELQAFLDQAS